MIRKFTFTVIGIMICSYMSPCWAEQTWELKRTYESKSLIGSPFFLFTAADLNNNGIKELIVTDFGEYGDHIQERSQWKEDALYTLQILEWEHGELNTKYKKQWDMRNKPGDNVVKHFMADKAKQIVPFRSDNHIIVETVPPFLGIEWKDGKYFLREQQGPRQESPLVGSWIFPWVSPSCYNNFPKNGIRTWPQECLFAIRDFSGNDTPKIVTILQEEITRAT